MLICATKKYNKNKSNVPGIVWLGPKTIRIQNAQIHFRKRNLFEAKLIKCILFASKQTSFALFNECDRNTFGPNARIVWDLISISIYSDRGLAFMCSLKVAPLFYVELNVATSQVASNGLIGAGFSGIPGWTMTGRKRANFPSHLWVWLITVECCYQF